MSRIIISRFIAATILAGLSTFFVWMPAFAIESALSARIEAAVRQYAAKHPAKPLTSADVKAIAAIAAEVATATGAPPADAKAKLSKAMGGGATPPGPSANAGKDEKKGNDEKQSPSPLQLTLAKDFANVGVSLSQLDTSKTTGATFSLANDQLARNSTWTARAVGTLAYYVDPCEIGRPDVNNGFICTLFGVYGGINKVSNSNPTPKITSAGATPSKSMDNTIWGGFAETAFQRSRFFQDFFRMKAGGVTNNLAQRTLFTIGKTTVTTKQAATQFAASFEWFPVYDFEELFKNTPTPCLGYAGFNKGFSPLSALFCNDREIGPRIALVPELYLEYDNTFDTTHILAFSNKSSAFRAGPQIGLLVVPFPHADEVVKGLNLENLSIYTVYHFYHEFISSRNNYVFQTNLNYKFPKTFGDNSQIANDLGLSFQYQRGVTEDTGQSTNLYTIGLTGTFCWGGYCS